MIFDVNRYAQIYYQNIQPSPGNDYPRLKAWEFLYEYIWDESRPRWADLISEEQIDTTALHIGFYLANWGMFRGSSGLLQNSNLDLMKALAKCLFTGQGPELFELSLDNFAPGAPDLAYNQALLDSVLTSMETLATNVSWTDTLKTKILMGVWGECPALDRFYIAACRDLFPRRAFITTASGKGLTALAGVVEQLNLSPPPLKTGRLKLPYPMARVMDMALFQYGLGL
ncbi:hypothetical protein HT121_23150 [Pseudomonas sp. MAFF 301514]|uniref:Uncharacterized protein n=1 Tax=Pseudomonas allii TaxID=2740531 RepID=A0A7Y8RSD1_9PSED|nr:hypothetical protein [Pseudomonas allii]NWN50293.1 hypothetical protein [Pseudomonas allii]NWN64083.1 hypothetical protein [Pseudomonas allii]